MCVCVCVKILDILTCVYVCIDQICLRPYFLSPPLKDKSSHLSMISQAYDLLLKYVINLLKPKRPQVWRSIKTTNSHFCARVDCMVGARHILKDIGYSVEQDTSMQFPDHVVEPDKERLHIIAAELLMAKLDVEDMIKNQPPPGTTTTQREVTPRSQEHTAPYTSYDGHVTSTYQSHYSHVTTTYRANGSVTATYGSLAHSQLQSHVQPSPSYTTTAVPRTTTYPPRSIYQDPVPQPAVSEASMVPENSDYRPHPSLPRSFEQTATSRTDRRPANSDADPLVHRYEIVVRVYVHVCHLVCPGMCYDEGDYLMKRETLPCIILHCVLCACACSSLAAHVGTCMCEACESVCLPSPTEPDYHVVGCC